MPRQLLNRRYCLAPVPGKVRCKRSGERYGGWQLLTASIAHRLFHGSLHHGGVEVVSSLGPLLCDSSQRSCWGNTHLPGQLARSPWCNRRISNRCCRKESAHFGSGAAIVSRSFPPLPSEPQFTDARKSRSFTVIQRLHQPRPLAIQTDHHQCRHPF